MAQYGDGKVYEGECLCHGIRVSGPIARSRPRPYRASEDPFGGPPYVRVIFVFSEETGAHEIPLKGIKVGHPD